MVVVRWPALPLRSIKGSVPFCLPRRAQRNSGVPFWASKKGLAEGKQIINKISPN
jgi:hypothetical protein